MKVLGKRAMLNRPGFGTTAAIVAEVEDTSGWKPGCDREGVEVSATNKWGIEPDYTFQVSDCSRAVVFELDFHTPEGRSNSLYKIDTMIAVLTAFRKALAAEQKRFLTRQRRLARKKD